MNQIKKFLGDNWKPLAALVVVIAVALGAYGWWSDYSSGRERLATNLLYEAQLKSRLHPQDFAQAEQAFQPLLEKYPASRAAFEAHLQMGDMRTEAGNYAEAITHYKKAAGIAKDAFAQLLVEYTLGVALESSGNWQEAAVRYEKALSVANTDFLRPELLLAQARCYEALQQPGKAVQIYKQIQEKFATNAYYNGAAAAFEKRLSGAKAL